MKHEKEIIEAIKQILSLYKIDLGDSIKQTLNTLDKDKDLDYSKTYSELIEKTQERIEELNKQTALILSKTGMSEDEMDIYSSNPNNFSPEEWQSLQKIKQACDDYKKETELLLKEANLEIPSKKVKPIKQQIKKKNKKKNWIPM